MYTPEGIRAVALRRRRGAKPADQWFFCRHSQLPNAGSGLGIPEEKSTAKVKITTLSGAERLKASKAQNSRLRKLYLPVPCGRRRTPCGPSNERSRQEQQMEEV